MRYNRKQFTNNILYARTGAGVRSVSLEPGQSDAVSQDCDSRVRVCYLKSCNEDYP